MKYICTLCNYILDEGDGIPAGPSEGTKFDELSEGWNCPDCAASKEFFQSCSCVSLPLYEETKVTSICNLHKTEVD